MSKYQHQTIREAIRAYLTTQPEATAHQIAVHLGRDPKTIYAALRGMKGLTTTETGYTLNPDQ